LFQAKNSRKSRVFNYFLVVFLAGAVATDFLATVLAGAFAVVLELIPAESAKYITENLKIPTIGIGAGVDCDGQIVVTDDILGKFTDFAPKFVKKFANLHDVMLEGIIQYSKEVKDCEFPSLRESFELKEDEREKLYAIK